MSLLGTPIEVEHVLAELGQRLSVHRRLSGLTQRDLADRIGVGTSTIVSLENGSPGVAIGTLARVLWALNVLDDLDTVAQVPEHQELVSRIPKRIRGRRL